MGSVARAINIADLKAIARTKVPRIVFDFVEGGVEDEIGLTTNSTAFSKFRFLPKYCVDTTVTDQGVSIFGKTFSRPFGISPTGMNSLYRFGADLALAKVAREEDIAFTLSSASNASLEEAAGVAAKNLWFQIYGARNRDIAKDLVRRAVDSGVTTLFYSVGPIQKLA